MTNRPTILCATLGLALALGGCMGTENRGVESVHQPVVSRGDYALDLALSGNELALGEQQRLAGWLASLRLGYGDRVAVDDPADAGIAAREQVASTIASYGLLLEDRAPVTAAPVAPRTVRVVVSRMNARVANCPDWSRDSSHEFDSNTSSNYGCAVNRNLAAMVASPEDLVTGAAGGSANDAATSFKAIDAFRKATPTGSGGTTVKAETTGSAGAK